MFGWVKKPVSHMGFIPRSGCADYYPYDLDGSMRYTRLKTGIDYFPEPNNNNNFAKLGCVSGFMKQNDAHVWAQMYGKDPFGPITSLLPINLQWQITVPGLIKGVSAT